MIWLVPAALAGFVLVAGPLALHLLTRHQARRLPFPTIRFVQPSNTAAVRLQRPTDVWLMLLRIAAVACAVAAAAQPLVLSRWRVSSVEREGRARRGRRYEPEHAAAGREGADSIGPRRRDCAGGTGQRVSVRADRHRGSQRRPVARRPDAGDIATCSEGDRPGLRFSSGNRQQSIAWRRRRQTSDCASFAPETFPTPENGPVRRSPAGATHAGSRTWPSIRPRLASGGSQPVRHRTRRQSRSRRRRVNKPTAVPRSLPRRRSVGRNRMGMDAPSCSSLARPRPPGSIGRTRSGARATPASCCRFGRTLRSTRPRGAKK